MQRMTQVLSRILNDPATMAALDNPPENEEDEMVRERTENGTVESSFSTTSYSQSQRKNKENGFGNARDWDGAPILNVPFLQKYTGHRNVR